MLEVNGKLVLACLAACAVLCALIIPGQSRAEASARDAVIAQLAARAEAANAAFVSGDMRRWYGLVSPLGDDFTLMQPFGGVSRGFDGSEARLDSMARMFTGGEASFELIAGYATRDQAVLVFIERQRATVGGLPEQDWSLRVTQVYLRRGRVWELAHRHADVLTENIGLERTAALAREG